MWISKSDKRKCSEVYCDLVSELWHVGKPLIREGQLKGIDPDTVEEMCQRSYTGNDKVKIQVEPKKLMKKRIHRSPDRSDAYFCMVHTARMRHGLSSIEVAANHKSLDVEMTELARFYANNPQFQPKKPKIGSLFKKRDKYESLETNLGSW